MNESSAHHRVISVSASYHNAVEHYIRHFGKLIGVVLIPNILIIILGYIALQTGLTGIAATGSLDAFLQANTVSFWVFIGIMLLTGVVVNIGLIAIVYMVVHNERVSMLSSFEHSLAFFWRFLAQAILTSLAWGIGYILGAVIIMLIGILTGAFSIDLFNEFFVWLSAIPLATGSLVSALFMFAPYSLVDKNQGVFEALRYSWKLVRGHFIPVVIRLFILYAAMSVVALALQFIPLFGALLWLLTAVPFTVVYVYVLYRDLERNLEGDRQALNTSE